ncbi:type II secretion system F family protein [Caldivirga maquilingensis]|uniref:Type II secretion system protein n=1 Tax=Caldivirga maquilingensis (strain ATCC 700844 / DSM 13496 / JCM 10307 / IC-167) TaxID=397948 RepID=A8MA00_CALMQ|nr:type II secretion system F family protein [Caldivirga maquilingensis]ABW02471.1 type II secretion system protein [Caldivirga maquilingensis IC-167]
MDFDELSLVVTEPLVNWYVKRRGEQLERVLKNAKVYMLPERFMARVFFATIITAVLSVPIGLYLTYNSIESIMGSFNLTVKSITVLSIGLVMIVLPFIVYVMMMTLPKMQLSDLQYKVDSELPFFAAYLAMISQSGLSVTSAIERLANIRLLEAIGKIAREIVVKNKAIGMDPLTALTESALSTPSHLFQNLIMGYVTNVRTGGDILHYLEIRLNEIVNDTLDKIRRGAEFLSTLMESYIGAGVILLIGLNVLYLAQAITPTGNSVSALQQAVSNNLLFGLLVIPAISVAFIYLGEVSIYRVPYTDVRPYIAVGVSSMVAMVALLIGYNTVFHGDLGYSINVGPVSLDFATYMAVVLIIAYVPAALYAERVIAERRSLERAFSDFLRDFTELRKSGFTPEKIISTLADTRDYGALSRYLKDISKQIRYGIPIRVVLSEFMNRTRSYYARVFAWLLLESIEYGGATPETLESLASFSSLMIRINDDLLARLKPLRFVPYIGAMILTLTLVIMVFTVVGLSSVFLHIPQYYVNYVVGSFALTIVVDSFVMGLVAGKLGEGELSAGFKHAVAITAIVLVIYLASPLISKVFVI